MFARVSISPPDALLRLEHLNPVQTAQPGTPTAPPPFPPPGTPAAQGAAVSSAVATIKDGRIGYSIAVTGTYSDLAAFFGALTDRLGYTVIKSVSITQPDLKKPSSLRALIQTEHIAMDLSAIEIGPVSKPHASPCQSSQAAPSLAPTNPSHDSGQE